MAWQYAIVEPDPSTMTRADRQLSTWMEGTRTPEQVAQALELYRRNHPEVRLVRRIVGPYKDVEL